jgi:dTDP-4-dehydrorhamnose 3,5-epimerase-like enzyme
MEMHMALPKLIDGAISADDRGEVSFVNDFTFGGVKRFYVVSNYRPGLVRAWHGHRHEEKYVIAVCGAAVVCAVKIDNWERQGEWREKLLHSTSLCEHIAENRWSKSPGPA